MKADKLGVVISRINVGYWYVEWNIRVRVIMDNFFVEIGSGLFRQRVQFVNETAICNTDAAIRTDKTAKRPRTHVSLSRKTSH